MPIFTPRLCIRPLNPGEGDILHQAKIETIDELYPWMEWAADVGNIKKDELFIRQSAAKYILREEMVLGAFDQNNGELCAMSGYNTLNWRNRIFTIGYWVRKSRQGQGLAQEITNALIRYAFAVFHAQKVDIFHAEGNNASQAVIEKLGFVKEGILRNHDMLLDGQYYNEHLYARYDIDDLPDLEVIWDKSTA